jgi:hypothetical protein
VQRTDKKVTIDLGRLIGVRPGMRFVAYKEGKVIKHPKTGEVLDIETIETGIIEITDARDKTANGVIVQEAGQESVVYGTMVRSTSKEKLGESAEEPQTRDPGERRGLIPMPRFFRRGE